MESDQIELETRLAFQDEHLHQIDLTLIRQQMEIDALRKDLREVLTLVREMAAAREGWGGESQGAEPPPPHY